MDETGTEAGSLKGRIKDAVDTLAGDARGAVAQTRDVAHGAAARDAQKDAQKQANDFGQWLEGFVKGRPLLALLAAAGIGYSLAGMGRRRRR